MPGVLRAIFVVSPMMFCISYSWATKGEVQPAQERIAEWAQMLPESLQGLGPKITERAKWETLKTQPTFRNLVREAETLFTQPVPELTDELYLEFLRSGKRGFYESVSHKRRERLGKLVLAECLEHQGRFLPAVEEAILALCKEKTWVLPAHDHRLANFEGTTTEIDLWSAMTSWSLATAYYWLGEQLAPPTRKVLLGELERRIFTPFNNAVTAGEPQMWWLTHRSNWNAVCLAGVTGAALATIEPRERRAWFAATAEKNIQHFLAGFTPDGYCSEGLGYWNYGFGHFVMLAEALRQASSSKIDLLTDDKVQRIAQFGRRMEILPRIYPAFADCPFGSLPNPSLMTFLDRRFGWSLTDSQRVNDKDKDGLAAWLYIVGTYNFLDFDDSLPPETIRVSVQPPLRDWFPDGGVLICRPAANKKHAIGAAFKGGHNAELHNHNDVGSFVVALGGTQLLVDPGSEVYTARTFGPKRYESRVLNSFGHPVPVVAGQLQQLGRQAAARVLQAEFTDESDTLVLDLTSAYRVWELKRLERTFLFSRTGAGRLVVTDVVEFDSPQAFGNALVTFSQWSQPEPSRLVIGGGPDCVTVDIQVRGSQWRVVPEEIHEELHQSLVPIRLGIELTEPVISAEVTLTIEPKQ